MRFPASWAKRNMTIERDMLGHGDDSNPHPALVRLHAGHEGPGVRLRVVHLHRGEVLHAIVATYGPESVHVCHQGYPAASDVHAADVAPPEKCQLIRFTFPV